MTAADIIRARVGEIVVPMSPEARAEGENDGQAGPEKEKVKTTVVLAFQRDGKGVVAFFEPARDIDPKGEKGMTYDYPLTGTWKIVDGAVVLTPDASYDEVTPEGKKPAESVNLALTKPAKDRVIFDLAAMAPKGERLLKRNLKVDMHSATDAEIKHYFGGLRPE